MEEYGIALDDFKKVCDINEQVFGKEDLVTAESYRNIAAIYGLMEQYGEAKEYFQKAYDIYVDVYGSDNPKTKEVKGWLEKLS